MNPLYTTLVFLIAYILVDWATLFTDILWIKVVKKLFNTAFLTSTAWLFYDYAQWDGEAHHKLLVLINAVMEQIFSHGGMLR